jgi:excisionase family DNA binding protein
VSTEYLTVQEVAERMRCEHRTVRRAIKSGELEAAMIGGRWVIREEAIDAWFQSRCAAGQSPAPPRRERVSRRRSPTPPDGPGSVARLQAIEGSRR